MGVDNVSDIMGDKGDKSDRKTGGGLSFTGVDQSDGAGGASKDLSAVKEAVERGEGERPKRGRGRPKGSGGKNGSHDLPAELDDVLFSGKAWEEIAALPFNVRRVMTGSRVFELETSQKKILGESLGAVMKALAIIDPKYVALSVFSINMTSIFAEKEIAYQLTKPKKPKSTETGADEK